MGEEYINYISSHVHMFRQFMGLCEEDYASSSLRMHLCQHSVCVHHVHMHAVCCHRDTSIKDGLAVPNKVVISPLSSQQPSKIPLKTAHNEPLQ